jgi:hypothetical protein
LRLGPLGPLRFVIVVVEGKVQVEASLIEDLSPDKVVSIEGATATCSSSPVPRIQRHSSSIGGTEYRGILRARMAVPRTSGGHHVQSRTEDVAELLTAIAYHQRIRVAKVFAYGAWFPAFVRKYVLVVDDHQRVNISDLLLILDVIGIQYGACRYSVS